MKKRNGYELVFLDTTNNDKFSKFVSFVDLECNNTTIEDYIVWYETRYKCLLIGCRIYKYQNRQLKIIVKK